MSIFLLSIYCSVYLLFHLHSWSPTYCLMYLSIFMSICICSYLSVHESTYHHSRQTSNSARYITAIHIEERLHDVLCFATPKQYFSNIHSPKTTPHHPGVAASAPHKVECVLTRRTHWKHFDLLLSSPLTHYFSSINIFPVTQNTLYITLSSHLAQLTFQALGRYSLGKKFLFIIFHCLQTISQTHISLDSQCSSPTCLPIFKTGNEVRPSWCDLRITISPLSRQYFSSIYLSKTQNFITPPSCLADAYCKTWYILPFLPETQQTLYHSLL